MQPRGFEQLLVLHVPDSLIRPTGDIADELAQPLLRIAPVQLCNGFHQLVMFFAHGSASFTVGIRVTSKLGKS
jgi:hypothetical protein